MAKRIFIGSSSEAKDKAGMIDTILRGFGAETELWFAPGAFTPSDNIIDELIEKLPRFDGAAFIFNKDDAFLSRGKKKYATRDNVLFEAGQFMGAHGKKSVVLIQVKGVSTPSDLKGVETVRYDENEIDRMTRDLRVWYDSNWIKNNVLMEARNVINTAYPVDGRLHIKGKMYKKIRYIRIMNMASNLIINPENAKKDHMTRESRNLSKSIDTILSRTSARMDFILLEPNPGNLKDIQTKIANDTAGGPTGALYSSLATLYEDLYGSADNGFKTAKLENRFFLKVMKTSMPFGIFNVEFTDEYMRFNHVKVDLYSAGLVNESERRSFVIFQENDPENYNFFVSNFEHIYHNPLLTEEPTEQRLKKWAEKWKALQNSRS